MRTITRGNIVTVSVYFTNTVTGAAVDPTTVTLTYTDPDGTEVEYIYLTDVELVKDAVGRYHVNIDSTGQPTGVYTYQWEGTGDGQALEPGQFRVKAAPL